MRIVHLSDIHFWRYVINPLRLLGKRLVGMTELVMGRAAAFRLERVADVVDRVKGLRADHVLITGDLTTTSFPAEFRAARAALADLLADPGRVTVIPGNHDRYTFYADRSRRFEKYFGEFAPDPSYPWLRGLGADTAILGLDPTRAAVTARGKLPRGQLLRAEAILKAAGPVGRLVIANHYPVSVPPAFEREYAHKSLIGRASLVQWLRTIGPHLYCCGHVHAAWAFRPSDVPNQLCLNAGAPIARDRTGLRPPGFLDITLEGRSVVVDHHGWTDSGWRVQEMHRDANFFETDGILTD